MKAIAVLTTLLCVVLLVAWPCEAITCEQVSGALLPCVSYLTGQRGSPTTECCGGVRNLRNMIPTQQDRRTACNCVKSAASRYPNLKPDAASNLPARCGVPKIPITPNTNCNTYSFLLFFFS
ncbi:hypothetical protein ACH5RR_011169 [Cinchona calisaya]|uniref:Non-specific lipid-transfer protein n=1 Tax=Cinchona calisaya TaxID=153742 RepID=A0ABD3A4P6_9GENT